MVNPNLKKYSKEDYDIAHKFAAEMYKEFGKFISCIAIFGSTARGKTTKELASTNRKGDIDVLVIVDDLKIQMSGDVVEAYRIIIDKMVAKVSTRLHVISLKLTAFWEYSRSGDPVAVNILRDGVALIDTSFFEPLQVLLKQGRIRPSPEAVWTYFNRAPATLQNAKWHVLQGVIDLYWAVIDSAHAAIMRLGEVPPSPEHVADIIEKKLVTKKLATKEHVNIMREFYTLQKDITYRKIQFITGKEFDEYLIKAKKFVDEMSKIVEM